MKFISALIDCKQTFKNANALLKDDCKFCDLASFKSYLIGFLFEGKSIGIMGLAEGCTISGNDENMPLVLISFEFKDNNLYNKDDYILVPIHDHEL